MSEQQSAGQLLRAWRCGQRLSQQTVANLAGVNRAYIAQMESGLKPVSATVLARLGKSDEMRNLHLAGAREAGWAV